MNEEKEIPYFQSRRLLNKDFPFKIFRYSSQLLKQTLHTHDYVQIAYVLKGMCNHTMLGKSLTVSRGDLFIITPGTGHSFSAAVCSRLRKSASRSVIAIWATLSARLRNERE
jgi:mannose-6-phosphate isomerase-like protein (cupin superfamily)